MLYKLEKAITPHLMDKILRHPFNQELHQGTLPIQKFNSFLEQDCLYLSDYSTALTFTADRLVKSDHKQLFYRLANEIRIEANQLQAMHPSHTDVAKTTPTFFQPVQFAAEKIPVISNYTQHLLTNSNHAPIEVAIASLLPCFFIYSRLGMHMQENVPEKNPYKTWIASYSNEGFLASTKSIIQITEELSQGLSTIAEQNMINAFVTSSEFELAFWDSAYEISFNEKKRLIDFHSLLPYKNSL